MLITNHLFYVCEKSWISEGGIEIGNTFVADGGNEVEVFNTYFVGTCEVLVHNYDKVKKVNENTYEVVDCIKDYSRIKHLLSKNLRWII